MSGTKQYPTRMHEVLGVETEERFTYSEYGDRKFWLSESGLMYSICDDGTSILTTQGKLVLFINHPECIIRKPRLSEEQVEQLKVAHQAFEFNWLARHKNGVVAAFKRKPVKGNNRYWFIDELVLGYSFGLVVREGSLICSLVSWSDPEPLDIVQTLKANGVEVE